MNASTRQIINHIFTNNVDKFEELQRLIELKEVNNVQTSPEVKFMFKEVSITLLSINSNIYLTVEVDNIIQSKVFCRKDNLSNILGYIDIYNT